MAGGQKVPGKDSELSRKKQMPDVSRHKRVADA